MGCGNSQYSVKFRPILIMKADDLIVRPNTFVHKNLHRFSDIYRLDQPRGSGDFTEVFGCTHKKSGRLRAVKIFKKAMFQVGENREYLEKEIETIKYLDHPFIIKFCEIYEDHSQLCIIMEHIEGVELFKEIVNHTIYKEKEIAVIAKQILLSLSYLHNEGIIIRQLKPEDILIDGLKIKLISLGSSCKFRPGRRVNMTGYPNYYVAPEVLNGNFAEKSDL